ncbi:MAG: organic hydroperoxide resistance protein [Acidobacteriaceae bacterium]
MLKESLYTANVTTRGARAGRVESSDGNLKLHLSVPAGMGGQNGSGTNPEQLFAAAYAACFGGAVQYAASQKKMETGEVMVEAQVSIGPSTDKQGFEIAVELEVTLPQLSQKDAEALVAEAHQICPYSNATRGNIEVKLIAHGGV